MPPLWLQLLAYVYMGTALVSLIIILWDIFIAGHHQMMKVMDIVWPVTALYYSHMSGRDGLIRPGLTYDSIYFIDCS